MAKPRPLFISYRREDSEGHAGRLYGDLVRRFGDGSVFMDVGIEPGLDFRKVIDDNVSSCGVLLALIGPTWLAAKDEHGQRRLDDPKDFVRLETAAALRRGIPVVPLLVHGARMPKPGQLPDDLTELAYRNGLELSHARWDLDVEVLIKTLQGHLGNGSLLRLRVTVGGIAGAIVLAVVAGVLLKRPDFVSVIKKTKPLAYFRLDSEAGLSEVGERSYSFSNGVTNSASCAPIGIAHNHCALLNGIDGKIKTSQVGGIAESGSMMIWLSLASLPSTEHHVFYLAGESEFRNDFDVQILADDTLGFFTDSGTYIAYRPDPGTLVNRWHMVVATLDKGVQTLYWDGNQVQSGGGGGSNKTSEFSIGDSTVFKGRFFHGSLDEVALWNRALSASEVARIYASTKPHWGMFFTRVSSAPNERTLLRFAAAKEDG
jgi:concanavalin A-like lectin/glucanase superfamily protein/TIR domain-containing protein